MNLIKLEYLNMLPLGDVRRKLDKKYYKMVVEDEIMRLKKNST